MLFLNDHFLNLPIYFEEPTEGTGAEPTPTAEPAEESTPVVEDTSEVKTGEQKATTLLGEKEESTEEEFIPIEQSALNFNIPEGQELDQEIATEFMDIVNNRAVSATEQAQKFVDLQDSIMTKAVEAQAEAIIELHNQWETETKADPIVGGDKLNSIVEKSSMILDQYGDKDFREKLTVTGLGNHISTIRFFNKLAEALGEGTPVAGSPPKAAENKSDGDRMFDAS